MKHPMLLDQRHRTRPHAFSDHGASNSSHRLARGARYNAWAEHAHLGERCQAALADLALRVQALDALLHLPPLRLLLSAHPLGARCAAPAPPVSWTMCLAHAQAVRTQQPRPTPSASAEGCVTACTLHGQRVVPLQKHGWRGARERTQDGDAIEVAGRNRASDHLHPFAARPKETDSRMP